MKMYKLLSIALSLLLSGTVLAERAADPDRFQIETIQLKFKADKGLDDLMALRQKFADFAMKVADIHHLVPTDKTNS